MAASATNYVTKFSPKVDEAFALASKSDALVNQEYDFIGAKSVKVYSVKTTTLTDYSRTGTSRFGTPSELTTDVQELTMSQDKAFAFTIDKMNLDETGRVVEAGKALARELREVVIPTVDKYRFAQMVAKAPTAQIITNATGKDLDATNVESLIIAGTEALDEAKVPEVGRVCVMSAKAYGKLKQSGAILDCDLGQEMKLKGVVAMYDGMQIVKVPSSYLPTNVNFILTHNIATCSPVKLADYRIHQDPPGISGSLVEGRIYYDAFVLDNKKNAIYVNKNYSAS